MGVLKDESGRGGEGLESGSDSLAVHYEGSAGERLMEGEREGVDDEDW